MTNSLPSRFLRLAALALVLATLTTVAACGKKGTAKATHYDEGETGFQLMAGDLVAAAVNGDKAGIKAITSSLLLPDPGAWFATTFGPEAKDRMLAEYNGYHFDELVKNAPEMITQLVKDDGRTSAEVVRVTAPTDDKGTGYQVTAVKLMKTPTPLYAMRLSRPDGSKTFSLWSFAYVDGAYRIVGKMKTADATPLSKDLDQLSELPVADVRELLGK